MLTLAQGASEMSVTAGGTGINSVDLIFDSFNPLSSPDATLNENLNISVDATSSASAISSPGS